MTRSERQRPALPQPLERGEIRRERSRIGRDEDAPLAEHGITGERDRAEQVGEVIGRVARRREHLQGPDAVAIADRPPTLAACGDDEGAREALQHRGDSLIVVRMIVRQGDPTQSAAARDLSGEALGVGGEQRTRIDQPRGVTPRDPAVRAGQRERSGIVGPNADGVDSRGQDAEMWFHRRRLTRLALFRKIP